MRSSLLFAFGTVPLTALHGCVGPQLHSPPPAAKVPQPITPAVTPERVGPGRYRILGVPADVPADDPRLRNAALWAALTGDETRDSREFYGGPDDDEREVVWYARGAGAFAPEVPGHSISLLGREALAAEYQAWRRGDERARSRWRLAVSVERLTESLPYLDGEILMVGFSTHESEGQRHPIGGGTHYYAIARGDVGVQLVYSGSIDP